MNVDINITTRSDYNEKNSLVNSMKNSDFCFQFELTDSTTKIKTIISLEQLLELKSNIDSTLEAYEKLSKMKF